MLYECQTPAMHMIHQIQWRVLWTTKFMVTRENKSYTTSRLSECFTSLIHCMTEWNFYLRSNFLHIRVQIIEQVESLMEECALCVHICQHLRTTATQRYLKWTTLSVTAKLPNTNFQKCQTIRILITQINLNFFGAEVTKSRHNVLSAEVNYSRPLGSECCRLYSLSTEVA